MPKKLVTDSKQKKVFSDIKKTQSAVKKLPDDQLIRKSQPTESENFNRDEIYRNYTKKLK